MEQKNEQKRYSSSFVSFDRVSVSKDQKKLLIFIGKMIVSLNLSYIRAILKNIDASETQSKEAS